MLVSETNSALARAEYPSFIAKAPDVGKQHLDLHIRKTGRSFRVCTGVLSLSQTRGNGNKNCTYCKVIHILTFLNIHVAFTLHWLKMLKIDKIFRFLVLHLLKSFSLFFTYFLFTYCIGFLHLKWGRLWSCLRGRESDMAVFWQHVMFCIRNQLILHISLLCTIRKKLLWFILCIQKCIMSHEMHRFLISIWEPLVFAHTVCRCTHVCFCFQIWFCMYVCDKAIHVFPIFPLHICISYLAFFQATFFISSTFFFFVVVFDPWEL